MLYAILAHPLGVDLLLEKVIRLGHHVYARTVKPKVTARLAHYRLVTVALHLAVTHTARIDGRRIRIRRIKYHGRIGRIHLSTAMTRWM